MTFKIEINNIKKIPLKDNYPLIEGNWAAEDSHGDDITYLLESAIPYSITDSLGLDHNFIEDVQLWHNNGSPIESECKEGIFTAWYTE
tara:strand:- start:349 stop:612 length:264 start_codon:yes stop_codon:yes gene_type:complete